MEDLGKRSGFRSYFEWRLIKTFEAIQRNTLEKADVADGE